jgi:hypothetical protein
MAKSQKGDKQYIEDCYGARTVEHLPFQLTKQQTPPPTAVITAVVLIVVITIFIVT